MEQKLSIQHGKNLGILKTGEKEAYSNFWPVLYKLH